MHWLALMLIYVLGIGGMSLMALGVYPHPISVVAVLCLWWYFTKYPPKPNQS